MSHTPGHKTKHHQPPDSKSPLHVVLRSPLWDGADPLSRAREVALLLTTDGRPKISGELAVVSEQLGWA